MFLKLYAKFCSLESKYNIYKALCSVCLTTWSTHFIEDTTLLDSSADVQLVTNLSCTDYVYLINRISRLDSTLQCLSSFVLHTLSWCQIVVRIKLLPRPYEQDFAVNFYSDPNSHTVFQEAFQEDLKYSDFFRDHLQQHIGDVRRVYFYGLEMGLERQTCTTELNTEYKVRKNIVNLRHFYFLQDHTTSDHNC